MPGPGHLQHTAEGSAQLHAKPSAVHRVATQLPGQRSGCDLPAAVGSTRTSLQVDVVAAPAPSAALPTSALVQVIGSSDDWTFVLPHHAAQTGNGLHREHHRELRYVSQNQREPLQEVGRNEDCDTELTIPCGAGPDVFAEEVILC